MTYDRYDFSQFQWGAGRNDVFDKAAPASPVQHLSHTGFQPRAFSCGEYDHSKIVGRHRPIILREQNQFRNASIAGVSRKCLIGGRNRRKRGERGLRRPMERFVSCNGPKGRIGEKPANELGMQCVTGLVRLDVTEQREACQRKVADEVERFVAAEFIGEA